MNGKAMIPKAKADVSLVATTAVLFSFRLGLYQGQLELCFRTTSENPKDTLI
jgi:hypothetical protein